jgi:hypothetical protein
MKYVPLDNIGLYKKDVNGNPTKIKEIGNNYPASDLGIPKSSFVKTEQKNIVLSGIYDENTVKYPLINPIEIGVKEIVGTDFKFLIKDIATQQLYASETIYADLITAYEERNPWYTVYSVPTINLDIQFLSQYHKINKFAITEAYADVKVTTTLDKDEEILQYIDWIVKPSLNIDEINIKPINQLGEWTLGNDKALGLGYRKIYKSMNENKTPDPEAIGATLITETYDISVPAVVTVSPQFQSVPQAEIIPKLVNALLDPRKPNFETVYNPLGEGFGSLVAGALIAAAGVLVIIGTGGAALPAVLAGAASLTPIAWNAINQAVISRFGGSYIEYILARAQSRGFLESKDSVWNKERDRDEKDWNSLLSIATRTMGASRFTTDQLKAALAIALAAGQNTRATQLQYSTNVGWFGGDDKWTQITVSSPSRIKLNLI